MQDTHIHKIRPDSGNTCYTDHAHYTPPTRKHELDNTSTDQELIFPERSRSSNGNRPYRSSVRGAAASGSGDSEDHDPEYDEAVRDEPDHWYAG